MNELETMAVTVDGKEYTLYRDEIMASNMATTFATFERLVHEMAELEYERIKLRHARAHMESTLQQQGIAFIRAKIEQKEKPDQKPDMV